ncbi:MAG TPA: tetratricopeptide repeat protein [Ktedonobacterales bacterium]|nr:tetratricopeptide repeat protein [Ktedonobacterales bacterium]
MTDHDLTPAIWLYVSDLKRSVTFYGETLGLPQIESNPEMPVFALGQMRLWLRQRPGKASAKPPAWGALLLPTPEGIEQRIRELAARGFSFSASLTETPHGRVAQFHDPDGHPLCFWETSGEQATPRQSQPAEASDRFFPEIARNTQEVSAALVKAEVAKTRKNYAEAARLYRVALDARPEQADPWCSLGFVLNELGKYAESLAATEMALALGMQGPAVFDTKGRALAGLGRYEESLECYREALALAPKNPDILAHEAAVRQAMG